MPRDTKIAWCAAIFLLLAAAGATIGTVIAQTRAADPKKQDILVLGQDEVAQLVLLMDGDKNGKISRKEFMDFMAAEFDRLDKDKSGELDVSELKQSRLRVSHFTAVGK